MNFPLAPAFRPFFFDMDGTLLDTLSDMQDAVNHILLENGWPQRTLEEIRAFVGNGAAKLMERAIPEPIAPQRFHEILASYKDWYQAHNCVKPRRTPAFRRSWRSWKKMGVKTAVVSNKPDATTKALAEKFFPRYAGPRPAGRRGPETIASPCGTSAFGSRRPPGKMPCMWATAR